MRERCDEIDPGEVRKAYKKIFAYIQRGKVLEEYAYLDNHYLLPGDGTGFFSSNQVHCKNCCVKHHNKCCIKFILRLPDKISHFKKNTYLLVKNPKQLWELYFINHNKQKININMDSMDGLQEILLDKARKDLSSSEKIRIKEIVPTAVMWQAYL